ARRQGAGTRTDPGTASPLFQGRPREGRARTGAWEGRPRQAPGPRAARRSARDGARAEEPPLGRRARVAGPPGKPHKRSGMLGRSIERLPRRLTSGLSRPRAERRLALSLTRISVTVNGTAHEREVEPRMLLVDFIRDELALTGTNVACDTSLCGA